MHNFFSLFSKHDDDDDDDDYDDDDDDPLGSIVSLRRWAKNSEMEVNESHPEQGIVWHLVTDSMFEHCKSRDSFSLVTHPIILMKIYVFKFWITLFRSG